MSSSEPVHGAYKTVGLGIILPPGLAPGAGANRLGISISAEVGQSTKKERLGLQSLLKFKWELAIGDKTISKKEFDRLMAQQSPLVEVGGEWIALQPSDVKAAQAIFVASKEADDSPCGRCPAPEYG